LTTNILKKLADTNHCPIALRREFLQFHSLFSYPKKAEPTEITAINDHDLLNKLYSFSNGVIFGEEHFDNLSVDFLVKNMEYLAELGVRTLFFEGLFFGLEKGADGNRDEKDSAHEEYGVLLDAARMNNIKLVGIDAKVCHRGEGLTRDIFMNIYAQSIINNLKGDGKWLALVGMMHLNSGVYINPLTFERHTVRGLAELTGSVSVILDSIESHEERYIKYNSEYQASPAKRVSADFIVGVHNKKIPPELRKQSLQVIHFNDSHVKFSELGITVSYYDIDSFARVDAEINQPQKGIIFSLAFDKLPPKPLEAYKYSIKAAIPVYSTQWLDIKTDALRNEIIFSCHTGLADDVVKKAEDILLESYETLESRV
jgi:hypothetical protein